MAYWEETLFQKSTHFPALYFRYLDDIFGIWHHDCESFNQFLQLADSYHQHICVKATIAYDQINFLDTTVCFTSLQGRKQLNTKIYIFKSTDTRTLLHKTSYHPKHTFKGLIKSQLIRFY